MALPAAEQILWGTNYENVLDFDYPRVIDGPRAWRRPAPGSEQARTPAGVTDAWITGYDYLLAGTARWFSAEDWGGPVGLQAFLDWAGLGNPFRFVPNKTLPDFYVDSCYLQEPFDDASPRLESANGSQSCELLIRNASTDFSWALRGLFLDYAPGGALDRYAFTRATTADFTANGVLFGGTVYPGLGVEQAASGVLRDRHNRAGRRTTLTQRPTTNIVLRSQELDNASWTKTRSSASANVDVAPDAGIGGSMTADRLIEDGTASNTHFATQAGLTITSNATCAMSVYAKAGTRSWVAFKLQDTAGTNFVQRYFNLGTGALGTGTVGGTGASVTAYTEALANGWYRLVLVGSIGSAVTSATATLFLATGDTVQSYSGDGASYVSLWGFQLENNTSFATAYVPTTNTSVTRNRDQFTWANVTWRPQAMWAYISFVEDGSFYNLTDNSVSPTLLAIGNATTGQRVILDAASGAGTYRAYHSNLIVSDVSASLSHGHALGDLVELLLIVFADGSVQLRKSVNGGTETSNGPSAAHVFSGTWASAVLAIGAGGSLANAGASSLPLMRVKLGAGSAVVNTVALARIA